MLSPIDAAPGHEFVFRLKLESFSAKFVKTKSNGDLVFEKTDCSGRWHLRRKEYIFMRCRGYAAKIDQTEGAIEACAVEPGAFEPIYPGDSRKIRARKKAHLKATIQQYYVMCMDELGLSSSIDPLNAFIEKHDDTHKMLFGDSDDAKAPGASTLVRLARECGERHARPFAYFLNGSGGDRRSGLWSDFIRLHKRSMVDWYWSPERPTPRAVKTWFKGEVAKERKRRLALKTGDPAGDEMRSLCAGVSGEKAALAALIFEPESSRPPADRGEDDAGFAAPCDSTLQNWIDRAATLANIAAREGRTIANRQIEGTHPHVAALRPLECVVMDHTQIDLHVIVYDETGRIVAETFRPWLIVVIDVYSRMVLAARLSMESPSLHTLNAGLKETLRPKEFLEHLGTHPAYFWALDGFGKFKRMLVDNELANIGRSMRATAASVGLNVSFAPVKTPPYKAIVERFFKTLNTSLWHEAEGGVPEKPGVSDVDPRKKARFTMMEAQKLLWDWVIKVYHLDVHDELEVPPALKWMEAFATYTRPLVNDMNVIDNAFGRTSTRALTRSGVKYRNEVFHEPDKTTALLDDLCHLTKNPVGTRKRNSTRSINVDISERETREHIAIYNPARGVYVELRNEKPENKGSYEDGVVERYEKNARIEAFFSRNDVDINKADIAARLTPSNPPPVVETTTLNESTADGIFDPVQALDGRSSPRIPAAHRRNKNVIQRPSVRRGRRRKVDDPARPAPHQKALERGDVDRNIAEMVTAPSPVDAAENLGTLDPPGRFRVSDGNAFLERMKAELKVSRE